MAPPPRAAHRWRFGARLTSAPWLLVLLLRLVTAPAPSWAADPAPPRDASSPLGPLISDATADGFALNIGTRDSQPHTARLLVYDAQAPSLPAAPPLAVVDSPSAVWHLLRVRGLLPAHRYRYRLELEGHPDSGGELSTAPPLGTRAPLLIAVFGDERDSVSGVAPSARAIVADIIAAGPDFVLGTGDLVVQGGRRNDWLSLLDNHARMFAQLPYFPALGNHELIGDGGGRMFKDLFPRAASGYYAVRYGQVQVVVLNGNRPGDPAQSRFLEDELRRGIGDPEIRARLILMHHAPLSASWHCGVGPYVADWMELFERYHVDVVLAGHDHSYQRLERNGVAYFVSGGGGAPLYEQGRCDPHDELALQHYAAVHHYMLVRVTPTSDPKHDAIKVTALVPQGPPLDEATLPLPRTKATSMTAQHLGPNARPPSHLRARQIWMLLRRYGGQLFVIVAIPIVLVIARRRARRRARKSSRDGR